MDSILELLFGPWTMVLLGGAVLAGVAVLVPMALILALRVVESGISGSRHALQVAARSLLTQADTRWPALQLRFHISRGDREGMH